MSQAGRREEKTMWKNEEMKIERNWKNERRKGSEGRSNEGRKR